MSLYEGRKVFMDYKTFKVFFDKMERKGELKVGEYTLVYFSSESIIPSNPKSRYILYYRDELEIGVDYIEEEFESIGSLKSEFVDSYDKGIKYFDNIQDYLEYLYKKTINYYEERRKQELERVKQQEINEKELNEFLGEE
ncbi:hypothetical protein [Staphylococcus virus vB_SurM-PSU5]|nr:hypothetical protein [Staphylococcus virus vB_SurM-PSU5]